MPHKITRIVGRPTDEFLARPPMPAGHPESWGLLTRGTALDGAAYPHPVFLKD